VRLLYRWIALLLLPVISLRRKYHPKSSDSQSRGNARRPSAPTAFMELTSSKPTVSFFNYCEPQHVQRRPSCKTTTMASTMDPGVLGDRCCQKEDYLGAIEYYSAVSYHFPFIKTLASLAVKTSWQLRSIIFFGTYPIPCIIVILSLKTCYLLHLHFK